MEFAVKNQFQHFVDEKLCLQWERNKMKVYWNSKSDCDTVESG